MDSTLVAAIQSFTLQARTTLEAEAAGQLEGIYGWLPDGAFAPAERCPALGQVPEAAEIRRRLERYADDERSAGIAASAARRRLVREAAFTWLNRLVALRMLEERKLLKPTVSKRKKSNGFVYWLTAEANRETYDLFQQGDLPHDPMGEGPADRAYRRFLLWQCGELARDVSVLFDPATLASRLLPRPPVLRDLVEAMNAEALVEAWRPGNEEVVGWVYQAFNAEELQEAFAAAGAGKKKFGAEEIPAVTQLFTTRWVVRFLVENSLGRFWVAMHPDSRLKNALEYLVPKPETLGRALKPVCEVTFLDPSCGSMHFGLVAFDLYAEMYREELENAGKPGWPEEPSVVTEDEIPGAIVAHNLHGLDLDLRAVQLAALALFLRARTLNPACAFTDRNLACANVEALTGGRLQMFIDEARFGHPIYERALRALAERLKDSDHLGSLLRLEKDLDALVAEEREKAEAKKELELPFPGAAADQFATREGLAEFFDLLTAQLQQYLDHFVRATRERGEDADHFAAEAAKGLRFLHLVERRYDVVATNPPYLSARKMSKRLADLLKARYPLTKQDLYGAFIQRCRELARDDGLVAMLTMHSFLFIKTYEGLREELRENVAVETLAHFGGGLFAVGNPGTLQTTAFVLRREPDAGARDGHRGVYFRLVREKDADAKRRAFEAALAAHRRGEPHPRIFIYRQGDFDAIPGKPWVYWLPEKLRELFRQGRLLGAIAPPRQGLATADNTRFLRKWWEVGTGRVHRTATSCDDSRRSGRRWFPYMKGGTPIPWHGNQEHVVNWKGDGAEIRNFTNVAGKVLSRPQNTAAYFRKGVTWSLISTKGFAARLSPGGFIFDVAGMTCFPLEESIYLTSAVMNSTVAQFILWSLNPTINYQVGDIERLPIPAETSPTLDALVEQAVALARQDSTESERTYDFVAPPRSATQVDARHTRLREVEEEIDREVTRLYGLTEEDRLALKAELEGTAPAGDDGENPGGAAEEDEAPESAWTQAALGRAWISYAFGTALGRYAIGEPEGLGRGRFDPAAAEAIRALVDPDGLMASEEGHPQDAVERTWRILVLMRGEAEARVLVQAAAGNGGAPEDLLRTWLERFTGNPEASFWRHHLQLYRKRPIYWPLQSPKRTFTVWVFQERLTGDALFQVRRQFVETRVSWLEGRLRELRAKVADAAGTRERRDLEKEISRLADLLDDVQAFATRLNGILQRGYTPHIDDGVLLNAAALWELLPSWADTKKAWASLENGEYDWAHQAMEHWPDRVRERCKTNQSFAIAHGLA